MSIIALHPHETKQHSYCFYKELSFKQSTLITNKQIIPSIPRQHFKAPKNSSLSPIRSQKIMPKPTTVETMKRPPLQNTYSSPASIQTTPKKNRSTKVSFDKKVMVVCTVFDESDEEEEPAERRHSTGERTEVKSTLQRQPIKQKLLSLKQFKNRLF